MSDNSSQWLIDHLPEKYRPAVWVAELVLSEDGLFDKVGGAPPVGEEPIPQCQNCSIPLTFAFQITQDDRLSLDHLDGTSQKGRSWRYNLSEDSVKKPTRQLFVCRTCEASDYWEVDLAKCKLAETKDVFPCRRIVWKEQVAVMRDCENESWREIVDQIDTKSFDVKDEVKGEVMVTLPLYFGRCVTWPVLVMSALEWANYEGETNPEEIVECCGGGCSPGCMAGSLELGLNEAKVVRLIDPAQRALAGLLTQRGEDDCIKDVQKLLEMVRDREILLLEQIEHLSDKPAGSLGGRPHSWRRKDDRPAWEKERDRFKVEEDLAALRSRRQLRQLQVQLKIKSFDEIVKLLTAAEPKGLWMDSDQFIYYDSSIDLPWREDYYRALISDEHTIIRKKDVTSD